MCLLSFCCRSASCPLPTKSDLKCPMRLSTTTSLMGSLSLVMRSSIFSARSI